jgi:hypothetical protein
MNDQPTPSDAGQPTFRDSSTQGLAAQTGERVKGIIEAAERTAAAIVADAEAQARKQLAQARVQAERVAARRSEEIAALTGDLISRTEAVRRQSDELLQLLDEAQRRIGGVAQVPLDTVPPASERPAQSEEAPRSAGEQPTQHLRAVEPQPGQGTQSNSPFDGARLLATQMAVAGSGRAEIDSRLRNEFGIEDPGPMLDAILGEEE